jgi:hypothetical protein
MDKFVKKTTLYIPDYMLFKKYLKNNCIFRVTNWHLSTCSSIKDELIDELP